MQFTDNKKCGSVLFVTPLIALFLKKTIFYSFKQSGIIQVCNIGLVLPGDSFHGVLEM